MNIFPEVMSQVETIEQPVGTENTSLRTYAFDIEMGEFLLQANGNPVLFDGAEAINQNAQKALSTERYTYPIYTSVYGHELKELIREDGTREWKQVEAQRLVREAVEYLFGVNRCENFSFQWKGAALKIYYLLVTDEGTFPQEVIVE